jgi:HK97 family phage portal protein
VGIRQWFLDLFDKEGTLSLSAVVARLATEVYYKELAVQACANLIAKTMARAEFRTFLKGQEVREDMYYLLNVEPNPNQNASDFWRDAVYRAVTRNEALIIMADNYLYLADSWSVVPGILVENLYTEIRLGELREPFKRRESEVLHLRMHNEQAKQVIDGLYDSYSKLIAAAQKRYRRNSSKRGFLELGTSYPQTEKAQADLKDLLENRFKTFFQHEDDAVLPLTGGAKWQELETTGPTARGSVEGRDIREFINDVFDFTAVAFQVPPQLLKGNVADTHEAMKNFLTFCINPLADMIGDEINRKMYGKRDFKKRSYVKVDTTHIRAVDIKDVANALDVLFRIGAYTIDDCLKYLGMEPIGGEVGQQRFVTKNYQPIEDVIDGGGGEQD